MSNLTPLRELAPLIAAGGQGKSWYAYAQPYVEALYSLDTVEDNYYQDSGKSIVNYTLANLSYWRGDTAKAVKAQLKAHLK